MNIQEKIRAQIPIILEEVERARERYGPIKSGHEGYAVLLEEVDEVWDEIKKGNMTLAKEEMIQVAATAISFLIDIKDGEYKQAHRESDDDQRSERQTP